MRLLFIPQRAIPVLEPNACCVVDPLQAAQALEPATLVAIQMLAPGGRCVLVGDPKQLPATVISSAAGRARLTQSLFERLQRVRRPSVRLPACPSVHT
jgi:AAA domain